MPRVEPTKALNIEKANNLIGWGARLLRHAGDNQADAENLIAAAVIQAMYQVEPEPRLATNARQDLLARLVMSLVEWNTDDGSEDEDGTGWDEGDALDHVMTVLADDLCDLMTKQQIENAGRMLAVLRDMEVDEFARMINTSRMRRGFEAVFIK